MLFSATEPRKIKTTVLNTTVDDVLCSHREPSTVI